MTLPRRFTRSLAALAGVAGVVALAIGTAVAANGDVDIDGLAFKPAEITVNAGDKVTWTVTNAVPEGHSVTSGAPGDGQGDVFDSGIGLTDNGQTFEFTFEDAGTFSYFCVIHGAQMSGTVTVLAAEASAEASAGASAGATPAASEAASTEPSAEASPESTVGTGSAESPPPGTGPLEPTQVPAERRALAAGILAVAIVIMFGGAAVWRRMNPA